MHLTNETIGGSWLDVARAILRDGQPGRWNDLPFRELVLVTLSTTRPDPSDAIIARHADPDRLAWMHANFVDHDRVRALGDADSYATRLYDYERSGRDQIGWVVERLAANPACRDATITTMQPHTDTSYIPCVSLLDFFLDADALQLSVYAHSIDFGTKGYANLVELADLQHRVARNLGTAVGTLTMTVKSAHVYDTELDLMRGIVGAIESQS